MSDFKDIDILRARVFASMPSKQNSQSRPIVKQPEVEREEGELCSSDDDQVSLSSQPTSGRGLPSNHPRLGEYPVLVPQENVLAIGIPEAPNVLTTEATSAAANVNGNAIVRKSEFLSGLSAPAPFTISLKSPIEVEITKFSVASQTQAQKPLADVETASQHECSVQISERTPATLGPLLSGSAKRLSAAAPFDRPSANGFSARQPITLEKNSGRAGDVTKVSVGTPRLSSMAGHKTFSPPFVASHRPLSPLVGARSSKGARSPPVPRSSDSTEADKFLAGLSLPGSTKTNSEFIINFDDSDSDGDRGQARPAQVLPRRNVNRVGAAGDKSISRILTSPNGNSEPNHLRVGRKSGMSYNKNYVKTGARTMVRTASLSKSPPPRPDAQIETLRQMIAAKESQIQQSKRVSQVPEPRSHAAAVNVVQGGTQKVGRTLGNSLAVNSARKASIQKKPRIPNPANLGPGPSRFQAHGAEPSERGRDEVDVLFHGKSPNYLVSTGPSVGNVAVQQADVAVLRAKESNKSSLGNVEDMKIAPSSSGAAVIPTVPLAEASRPGSSRGTSTSFSTRPASSGLKTLEPGRSNSGGLPIESGGPKLDNAESHQIAPKATGARKTESADVTPVNPIKQSDGNRAASASVVSGEGLLESMRSGQVQGVSLKKRGIALGPFSGHQKRHKSSNDIIQPSNRPSSDFAYLGSSASEIVNNSCDVGGDDDKLLAKRRRTGEHAPQVFSVAEITASLPPLSSLPGRRSSAEFCPPYLSPTDQVEKCGGESRVTHAKNGPNSASALRLDSQLHSELQKLSTVGDNVSSKEADLLPANALRDSGVDVNRSTSAQCRNSQVDDSQLIHPANALRDSGVDVNRSTSAQCRNSQVDDSQLIQNGENMPEMVNATVSRVLEAQETDIHLVAIVDGEGLSGVSLQPSRDVCNTNFVTNNDAAGIQIVDNDGNKLLPAAIDSNRVMQSDAPDKVSLRDDHEFAPNPKNSGGYNSWPTSQHFEVGGRHLDQLRMQHTLTAGSQGHSLENLREEEDSVDKDLEEAQAHRRDCEIRQREIRRAYREAEIALSKANARCEALSQRQKFLSVQVQTIELRQLQHPSFSVHSNSPSLVPFSNIALPRITELPFSGYPSQAKDTTDPPTESELGIVRVSNEHEAHFQSPAQVDYHTLKEPSSSADTEILEENLDETMDHHGTRSSGGQIPSKEEATVGYKNAYKNAVSDENKARHSGVCSEGKVSVSANSDSATSSQRLKIKRLPGINVSSDSTAQRELLLNSSVEIEGLAHEDQDPLNRFMTNLANDDAVPQSKDEFHIPFTSTSIGQVEAEVTETKVYEVACGARVMVNSTDSGFLEPEETRTAVGIDRFVQNPGQESFEKRGDFIRGRSSPIQKLSSADEEPSNVLNAPGEDSLSLNALGGATEEAFASVRGQDMVMVDLEVPKRLPCDSRSDGISISDRLTSKHGTEDAGCRDHYSDLSAAAGLTISLKNKREISGLRALAEDDELLHLDKGCEDQTIRSSSLEDILVEETFEPSRILKYQGLNIAQAKDSIITEDKGDCASRTSVSSEGEVRSSQGDEGREEGSENGVDEVCLKLTSPANSAKLNSDDPTGDGDRLFGTDVLRTSPNLVLADPSARLENSQPPSTALSIGFADFGTGKNYPALCLFFLQVAADKRFDEFTFRLASYESPLTMFRSYRICSAFQTAWHNSVTSQTWSHLLDPFKPLCMFEHRGKCKDDACPWQHVAHYTLDDTELLSQLSNYMNPKKEDEALKLSSDVTSISHGEIINEASRNVGSIIRNKFLLPRPFTSNGGSLAPLYKIGPYPVNQDESLTSRVRSCLSNQYKFNLFTSFTLSSAVRRPMHSDIPCLPMGFFNFDSQTTTADSSSWRYTGERSLASMEEHVQNEPEDVEAWLELALIRIDFDLNCTDNEAYNEALYVLSRALEANPSVATLWIVYIGLFYHGKSEIGDDDLFYHAIENSKGSYELLLLYINSRTTLSERLKAYELALEALINVGDSGQEPSACILDVFIQMLDCMCVARVINLLHAWSEAVVKTRGTSALVISCLTAEDRCILMVACAYAVAFGQLPQNYLLRVGCRQQLPWELDWSKPAQVLEGSKDLVLKIMEAGMHSASVLSEEVSKHVLAINYLKCLALYHGSDHALRVSQQMMERHSTWLELVLFIVHLERKKGWKEVFQQALLNPSEGSTDQQRLWYQYAVHVLKAEGKAAAMIILHQCASAACQGEGENCTTQVDDTRKALQLNIRKFEKVDGSCMIRREAVFAWMNLALYEMLSGNEVDAQFALEKSMKAAVIWEDVLLCWKELASFIRISKTGQEQASAILDLLDRGSVATGVSCKLVPLASKLLIPVSKRRVRVFLESLMGSCSLDHSLLNSLVEVIISKETSVTKEVAMIVEAVMDTFPGNYELLLQIFRTRIGNLDNVAGMSAAVWLSSLLFGSLLQSSPQACEQHWVEAGHWLELLQDRSSLRSFYQFALILHPFSASLKTSAAVFDDSSKPDVL